MSRKRGREQVGVALFPFLAVLICTMGALIVLLVLLVQQARVDASVVAGANIGGASAEAAKQLQERLEDSQWKREVLEKSRAEKTQELADARAKLAHFEEHAQRLAAQAKDLLDRARAIDERKAPSDDLSPIRTEIERLKAEIARRTKELEDAKKKQNAGKESYALIPYEGAAGTRRRPIYVECTEFGVIVQPEGILLRAEDFTGPLGPGNPLDVTLRAIREHLERTAGPNAGQPYPLLVVRPGGILAYGAARAAMKSWDDEFGYELISDEKHLDFGDADPALAGSLTRTLATARQRQAAMAAMMPRRYQDEPLQTFSSKPPPTETRAAAAGNGIGGTGAAGGTGASSPSSRGANQTGSYANGMGGAGDGPISSRTDAGAATRGLAPAPPSSNSWPGVPPSGPDSGGGASVASPGGTGSPGAPPAGGSTGQSAAGSSSFTSNQHPAPHGSSAGSGGSAPPGSAGQPTMTLPAFGQSAKKGSSQSSASSGGSKAGARGNSKTGKNWALPQVKPNQIGVTRPIRITVLPDRIVLAPERGDNRAPQSVPIAPELTPDDVTHLVEAVHKEVDNWGLAVADGYWKPVLQAEVAPGCDRHYENLRTALGGSGLDMIRR